MALGQIITQQPPTSLTVVEYQTATATVTASGAASYKWLRIEEQFAVEVDGQTTATLSLPDLRRNQAGSYICRVSGQTGTLIYSDTVRLTVTPLAIVYVTGFGAGRKNGSSWSNALPGPELQPYLASAQPGQQIWVSVGLFKPTTGTDRTKSFRIPPEVQLYGGFLSNETSIDQRPPMTHYSASKTILSGDIDIVGDNDSYHVVSFGVSSLSNRLDGFLISGGRSTGDGTSDNGLGGGRLHE